MDEQRALESPHPHSLHCSPSHSLDLTQPFLPRGWVRTGAHVLSGVGPGESPSALPLDRKSSERGDRLCYFAASSALRIVGVP